MIPVIVIHSSQRRQLDPLIIVITVVLLDIYVTHKTYPDTHAYIIDKCMVANGKLSRHQAWSSQSLDGFSSASPVTSYFIMLLKRPLHYTNLTGLEFYSGKCIRLFHYISTVRSFNIFSLEKPLSLKPIPRPYTGIIV